MTWLDRGLLLALLLGVWALVLKPSAPIADEGVIHSCTFTWRGGEGQVQSVGKVYVHSGQGSVDCTHS